VIVRENGVLVEVVDIKSGTWQMARDIIEALQKKLDARKKK
jgi:hypothetical protein